MEPAGTLFSEQRAKELSLHSFWIRQKWKWFCLLASRLTSLGLCAQGLTPRFGKFIKWRASLFPRKGAKCFVSYFSDGKELT
jgi:hypothetical protein